MALWQKLYYAGMVFAMLLIVTGELIWLPDPLRIGGVVYWIDVIDDLIYVLALIPIIWTVGAALHFRLETQLWVRIRTAAVCAAGVASAVILIAIPKKLEFSAGAFILTWLLVFLDLCMYERRRRKLPVRSLSAFAVTVGLLLVMFWPTKYLVTYPGLTLNMNRYAQVSEGAVHGDISGVLVFERPAFPIDWLYAKLFAKYSFEVENLGMTLGEYNQEVRTMKADANAAGSAVALQRVGKGKGITTSGVRITAILKDSPAAGYFRLGDVIQRMNGQRITMITELTERMKAAKPGDVVAVTVLRDGKPVSVQAATRANPDDASRAAFGIQVANEMSYDIPLPVSYHNYLLHEGGPSHGAMLALTLIDQLTPCGVTYGNHVAGTGTMEANGIIGAVGGLEQKAYTISRTNADVFFVPADNEAEARKGAPNLLIVPVRTLDDMLNWLQDHPKPSYTQGCS
ncbi:PDZ domain-containing protein [Paenibacillus sp. GCM10023248]|uniref:PDZ domain-containing protein n=1 Tax=Bacillales TaxID=1385 RepID=UPI0023798790|nr:MULTISPECIES: PDZ domain-containing protein [Bacillales]MDD9268029.1 PDZ domain-containing protein [Paenibacillus sp. MAHUQ-63]MDR6879702.1 PDZ domain-containing protein [Bacillus sp. 3255]